MFLDIIIIGGFGNKYLLDEYPWNVYLDDIEMISIVNGSVLHVNTTIPSLPKKLCSLTGGKLPNGNLLLRGTREDYWNGDEYLLFKDGSKQWTKVGASKRALLSHSSVLIDGCLLTTGGELTDWKPIANHEEFSLHGGVKERKEMLNALFVHTSTINTKF